MKSLSAASVRASQFVIMSSVILFLLILTYSFWNMLTKADEYAIKQDDNTTLQFSYFIDKSSSLSLDEAMNKRDEFIESTADLIPFALGDATYWIKLRIENLQAGRQKYVIHADNTMLNTFDVYAYNSRDKNIVRIEKIVHAIQPSMVVKIFPHVDISLYGHSERTFLIKLNTFGPPKVPLALYQQDSFNERVQLSLFIFGGFISVILLMTVYNFVLYRAIKDKVYLTYIAYLLSVFIVLASINGYGYVFFNNDIQDWLNRHIIFFHYTLVIFLLLFTMFFLRYDQYNNKSYRIGQILCLVLATMSVVTLTFDQILQAKIFFSLQPIIYVYALFIIAQRLKNDMSWARFYFLSWIPLLIGSFVQPLVLLNYLEYSFISKNAFLFGVLAEITFMSLALAERMRRNEQDRLFDISYHKSVKLPRKSTLENAVINIADTTIELISLW